jgi:hypothetical protein
MRTILRRLDRLEDRFTIRANLEMQRLADVLDERRRRRLEASGQSVEREELDWGSLGLPPGTRLGCRETLRYARQLRLKRDSERELRNCQTAMATGGQH